MDWRLVASNPQFYCTDISNLTIAGKIEFAEHFCKLRAPDGLLSLCENPCFLQS